MWLQPRYTVLSNQQCAPSQPNIITVVTQWCAKRLIIHAGASSLTVSCGISDDPATGYWKVWITKWPGAALVTHHLHNPPNAADSNFYLRKRAHIATINLYMKDSQWRHQMEKVSASLALCAENSSLTGEFLPQRPVARSFDVFFDQFLSKWLSKQPRRRWFETSSSSLWCH